MRDPGSTAIGEKIRHILLSPEHEAMSLRTEVLLYMAARAQLWSETLAPALAEGKCVVLDRWLSSTCAYQGYAGGFGIDNIIRLAHCSLERVWPDMTIILDTELATSSKRLKAQLDRMEQKGAEYHKKVRDGFLEVAQPASAFCRRQRLAGYPDGTYATSLILCSSRNLIRGQHELKAESPNGPCAKN